MKTIGSLLLFALVVVGCQKDDVEPNDFCPIPATVRDFSALDGCGWMFELEDGKLLKPLIVGYCGTGPFPEDHPLAPINNFELRDGMKVRINYTPIPTFATVCMNGTLVDITCMSKAEKEIVTPSRE